ncbi:MAG: OmpA family protein [Bacteroidetes bacterium]|nr:OmpA family protein [Bacteroidota bacterium]
MKKYLLTTLILSFFTTYLVSGQSEEKIKWYSFEDAVKLNKDNPKKMFIDIYTSWCGWCKVLDRETFSNPVITKKMNESFYAVKLNAERKDTVIFNGYTFVNPNPNGMRSPHELASSMLGGKMSYPSMIFLDENTKIITTIQSFLKPVDLEPVMEYVAQNKYPTMKYDSFKLTYKPESDKIIIITSKTGILNKVIFNDGLATLKENSYTQLDSMVNVMTLNTAMKIKINAYIDETGSTEKNKSFSTQRAKVIYDYFLSKKIDAARMSFNGYGYSPTFSTYIDGKKTSQKIEIIKVE